MERLKKCLICYSSSQSKENICSLYIENSSFGNTGKLAEETLIVFVIRSILKVPRSICARFLKEFGSPSDWCLTFCADCQELLNDAKEVAQMIYNLEGKLNGLRNKVKNEMITSYQKCGDPPRRNYHKHLKVLDEIRYYVAEGVDDDEKDDHVSENDGFDTDFHAHNSDNYDDYSDNDCKGEIEKNRKIKARKVTENDCGQRRSSRLRLRPRFPKTKSIKTKLKKEIKPELFKTIIPAVVPLNNSIENEAVDSSEPDSILCNIQDNDNGADNPSDDNKQGNDNETKTSVDKKSQDDDNAVQETMEQRYLKLVASARFRAERRADGRRMRQRFNDFDRPFKCSMCRRQYATDLLLQAHINRIHRGLKDNFICEICQKGFDRRSRLERHLKSHVNSSENGVRKKLACSQCPAKFSSELRLDIHVQKTHLGNQKPVACQQCNRKFEQLCSLEKHLREAHEMTLKSNDGYLNKRTDLLPRKRKKYKCPKCVRSFNSEDVRHSHIQRKHNGIAIPYQCNFCEKGFIQKTVLDAHLRSHERKANRPDFICESCGKHFKHAFHLKYHVSHVHENRHDFMCEICSKPYKSKKSLTHHQVTMHLNVVDVKHFDCDQCTRTFGTQGSLKNHVDQIHNNIYSHRCSYCNKGFTSEASKTDHENTHAGVKPHMCEICGRSFAWRKHLDVHKRIHTGEKPYHCDTCGQDFRDRTWFKRHQELHTGIIHSCHICGKGFPIKHNLGIHMKSHANKNGRNNKQMQNHSSTKPPAESKREKQTKKRLYENESMEKIECEDADEYQCQLIYS